MGDHQINVASRGLQRAKFIDHLLTDIESIERMLKDDIFEKNPIRIGSEQEFCIVDNDWTPSKRATEILSEIKDHHFTTELALYNLEINLDPIELKGSCFSDMMKQLIELLDKAKKTCDKFESNILLAGILPTISSRHIELEYMTPSPRYRVLNDMLKKLRGADFSVHIMGTEELTIQHDSVLFEACNTSFQAHLQIEPADFVSAYNWSQALAGPILAVSTNSPLLLGRELWSETRIALFQQSIDTRVSAQSTRQNEPRVTFGSDWIHESIVDIYKDDISRFQILINREIEESSAELLEKGIIPKLEALSLHNGTIYRWNRPCYGVANNIPHLRIENRYLPSGPTVIDEIANMAFWVGLMKGRPSEFDDIQEKMSFKDAKSNFYRAARYGRQSIQTWMGTDYNASELVEKVLLPIARKGLTSLKIEENDIDEYLGVIKTRLKNGAGADWQIRNYRKLVEKYNKDRALKTLSCTMQEYQNKNIPVGEWKDIVMSDEANMHEPTLVYQIMNTNLFTVSEDDSADLVSKVMQWKNIHHVPVENAENEIVGLLTWNIIEDHLLHDAGKLISVKDIMVKHLLTVTKDERVDRAEELMIRNKIGCLPVVKDKKLMGIITKKDLPSYAKSL